MGVGILVFEVPDDRVDEEVKRAYDTLSAAGYAMVPARHAGFEVALRGALALLDGETIPDVLPPSW